MRTGLIEAEGLFGEVIPGAFVGPCTAAAAHFYVAALPALALVFGEVTEVLENRRILPDFSEGLVPDVPGVQLQVSAGLYLSDV